MFAGFIAWLLSFPMDGVLLNHHGVEHSLLFFLVPHIAVLLVMSLIPVEYDLNLVSDSGIMLAGLSTLFYPFSGEYSLVFLVLCGAGSAPVVMRMAVLLKNSVDSFKQLALGLVAGNFLAFALAMIPSGLWSYAFISAGIALSFGIKPDYERASILPVMVYQPLILFLYIMAGLMYGFIGPGYFAEDPPPGLEIFFYIMAVLLGWYFLSRDIKGLVYIAIALALMAQPALYGIDPFFFTTGFFLMNSSMGFADFFVLCLAISQADSARAMGLNSATVCLGIVLGLSAGMLQIEAVILTAFVGNLGLAASILYLLFITRKNQSTDMNAGKISGHGYVSVATSEEHDEDEEAQHDTGHIAAIPAHVVCHLSAREKEVLDRVVMQGMIYREAAGDLGISESSVKSYMQRIFIKTGVKKRKELERICHQKQETRESLHE